MDLASWNGLLLKFLAKKAGDKLWAQLTGNRPPSYFSEVYKEIGEQIASDTINKINGKINGLMTWYRNKHIPRRDSGAKKSELHHDLRAQVDRFSTDVVAVLREPRYAQAGLGAFVIGASIHLILLQELARVDPEVRNPNDSSYVESLRRYAVEYADHAERTYEAICQAVRAKVHKPSAGQAAAVGTGIALAGAATSGLGLLFAIPYARSIKKKDKKKKEKEIEKVEREGNDPLNAASTWRRISRQELR